MLRLLSRKGFSLIEVVVTVAILAGGIVIVLQALSFSTRMAAFAGDLTAAVLTAQDKIQELEFFEKQGLIAGSESTIESQGFEEKYYCRFDGETKLFWATFEVAWKRLGRDEKIIFSSYLQNL